jgi:phage terminase large subunit
VHRLLSDQIKAMGLEGFYTIRDSEITGANGTQFLFAGIRGLDVAKIKSLEGIDRCWVEEANTVTKKSWETLIPTIRKDGSEIWISFNPELDSDETYQRFVVKPPINSEPVKINWSDNPWFPSVLKDEMESLKARDHESYLNVWEGNCRASVEGAIYANEIRLAVESHRIRPCPYDPILKVHAIWDLGWNDAMTVIMVQRVASSLSVIDYLETSHTLYSEIVNGNAKIKGLAQRGYRWGKDYLPHDGKAKNPQTGKSAIETLEALGRSVEEVPDIGVEEGIRAARQIFSQVYFDETKASRLVHCLKRYRRTINQQTNEPGAPLHDEFSHGADAFRYMAVAADGMSNDELGNFDPLKGWVARG